MRCVVAVLVVIATVARVHAQDAAAAAAGAQASASEAVPRWTWSTDANVFTGFNYQRRLYADFSAWESQNWLALDGERRLQTGRLFLNAMVSLEPVTVGHLVFAGDVNPQRVEAGGSPQLFQTGESFHRQPLVNYQHPHDLIMGLGVTYRFERERAAYQFTAALVGSPALGPAPFMHRESARDNPQTPLSHHALDSTHVTPGVVSAGIEFGPMSFEASGFRGEEPDENRFNIDHPRLDSWSARIGWRHDGWRAQVSGGHLHEPEWFEPWDATRLTASVMFDRRVFSRRLDVTAAWGRTIEYNGYNDKADSYLLEWDLQTTRRASVYGRAERARKQIFGLGFHPKGLNHRHTYSEINALTVGYVHDLVTGWFGRIGIGADMTGYGTSPDLSPFYGSSRSYHAFFRWRPNRGTAAHIH